MSRVRPSLSSVLALCRLSFSTQVLALETHLKMHFNQLAQIAVLLQQFTYTRKNVDSLQVARLD